MQKILIVDREIESNKYLKKVLEEDYEVTTVQTSKQCLDIVDNTFDLIVLEFKIDVMDGNELYKAIKEKVPNVKVIFHTLYAYMIKQADNIIEKGFNCDLFDTVNIIKKELKHQ